MKKILLSLLFTGTAIQAFVQADNQLSNLISPTKVNVNLAPDKDKIRNLGSDSKSWNDLYLDGSVYLGGARFLAYTAGTGAGNTVVGSAALNANTSGYYNTAAGFNALYSNTSGFSNTANGYKALYSNTGGGYNTANGRYALFSNTTADRNTANGSYALYNNTEGENNTANGYEALYSNTTGYENTANGYQALHSNTTGRYNTANGYNALYLNTGSFNTANGRTALYYNSTGEYNTANGSYALYSNTTGDYNTADGTHALSDNATGNYNTASGYHALSNSETLSNLVAVGDYSLYNLDGGSGHCTAVGSEAGINNTTGGNNTYMGYHAGNTVTTGSSNTIIGYGADVGAGSYTNSTALGNLAVSDASNHVRIGNSSVTSIGGQVGWTTFSDERIKNNVKENVPGLKFINLLKPVTYHYDVDKEQTTVGRKATEGWEGKYDIQKITFTGFLAQEVDATAKKIGYDFSGVDKPQNENSLYGLRYAEFVVPLVKAVQELSQQNDELKKNYEAKIDDLQKQIDELKALFISQSKEDAIDKKQTALE